MKEYKYIGRTSKDSFVVRGINVFAEKWCGTGSCAVVTSPLDNKSYTFSEYTSGGVKFVAGRDKNGYWLFFSEK